MERDSMSCVCVYLCLVAVSGVCYQMKIAWINWVNLNKVAIYIVHFYVNSHLKQDYDIK